MTLIELLAVVTIIVGVVAVLTIYFPRASRAIAANRQRLVATQLAQTLMQRSTKAPYALLDATPEITGGVQNFPLITTAPGSCDCNTANFGNLSTFSLATTNNITYSQSTCVNYTDPATLKSYCPGAVTNSVIPDPGLKTVHIRVWWNVNNTPLFIDLASKVARI